MVRALNASLESWFVLIKKCCRSGCKDTQTSADTSVAGEATGAMSWALVRLLSVSAPLESHH